jgi:hypothetical protein
MCTECHITLESDGDIKVTPRWGKLAREDNIDKKIKVHVCQRPSYDVLRINSPLARLLHSYRRLSELSSCYVEEERRVAKVCRVYVVHLVCCCVACLSDLYHQHFFFFCINKFFFLLYHQQKKFFFCIHQPVLFLEDVRTRDNR